ncbi:ABC transporter ATP-binding protein [Candidatus Dependentiae bacterium]|nr:ABC transporter ATP-binding protein [Candidatus Dependentiae bacterium]
MLKASNINFKYPSSIFKLNNISFDIKLGEYFGISGNNAAGKTTLLKFLVGIIPEFQKGDFSGEIKFKDKNISDIPLNEKPEIFGLIFQNPDDQFFFTTLEDEIIFLLENMNIAESEAELKIQSVLEITGLEKFRYSNPNILSYGQKKLALLCINLVIEPKILLLDEIFSSLDESTTQKIKRILMEHKNKNNIIINVDRNINNLSDSDKILILDDGEIAFLGNTSDFFKSEQYFKSFNFNWSLNNVKN